MVRWFVVAAATLSLVTGSARATRASSCASGLLISAKTGHVLHRLQLPAPTVVSDGRAGWFAAATQLTHLRSDGRVDPTWRSSVRRSVSYTNRESYGILARRGNRLYVAGRQRVVAVDAGTGRVLWLSPAVAGPTVKGLRATITAVTAGSRTVYLGGTFTSVAGARRAGLAALDASTGRLLPWRALPARPVTLLALSSSRLYFSGARVGAVRASDGGPTAFASPERMFHPIMLAVWGRLVLVGCSARWSNCESDTGVFDSRTGKPVHKFAFDEIPAAGAVGLDGPTAYLGAGPEGDFGGHNFLIAIDLRTGKFKPWFPKAGYYGSVSSIAVSGDRVLVAGSFCPGP
jgi:outer membrane protein assembly factor BamB